MITSQTKILTEIARIRWERPTSDKKVAEKLGITEKEVVELTNSDIENYEHICRQCNIRKVL